MDQGPLVKEQIDAGARFLSQFEKYAPVRAAFWLRPSEGGRWNLYVASDRIDDRSLKAAYGEVLRLAGEMQDPNFDPFQVKLVGVDDPLVPAVLEIQRRYRGKVPTRLHGGIFGGSSIDEVYIYPSPIAVPAG